METVIREATPGDEDAVAGLITAYLTWAHDILRRDYGVDEPPVDVADVRATVSGPTRPRSSGCTSIRTPAAITWGPASWTD
jgi:hypothetical protein